MHSESSRRAPRKISTRPPRGLFNSHRNQLKSFKTDLKVFKTDSRIGEIFEHLALILRNIRHISRLPHGGRSVKATAPSLDMYGERGNKAGGLNKANVGAAYQPRVGMVYGVTTY